MMFRHDGSKGRRPCCLRRSSLLGRFRCRSRFLVVVRMVDASVIGEVVLFLGEVPEEPPQVSDAADGEPEGRYDGDDARDDDGGDQELMTPP